MGIREKRTTQSQCDPSHRAKVLAACWCKHSRIKAKNNNLFGIWSTVDGSHSSKWLHTKQLINGQRQALCLEMDKSARESKRGNRKAEAMTMQEMHQVIITKIVRCARRFCLIFWALWTPPQPPRTDYFGNNHLTLY